MKAPCALFAALLAGALAACAPRPAGLVDGSSDTAAPARPDGSGVIDAGPVTDGDIAQDTAVAPASDTTPAPGACLDPADQALFDTLRERSDIADKASTCAWRCQDDADPEPCSRDCFADATELTPACAACHYDLYSCTREHCADACHGGERPPPPSCDHCALEQRCFATFYACAGSLSATDACLNPVDEPLLHTEAQRTVHHAVASACAMDCNLTPDLDQCAATCIADSTQLSAGCRDCYAQLVVCAGMRCASFCDQGLSAGWCAQCMRERDCYLPFYVCTGLLPD